MLHQRFIRMIGIMTLLLLFTTKLIAQKKNQLVRLAKIKVDSGRLDEFHAALKEQMTTAMHVEPGVLTYYAVAEKNDPSSITILEIYADTAAYNRHINTSHFKKYKEAVKDIVTALELIDVTLIAVAKKPGM